MKKVLENVYKIDDILIANFWVASDYIDNGYYNSRVFYQMFYMRDRGSFQDVFAGKYIPEVAQGYCDMERTVINISGLNKISNIYLTEEERKSGHVTESRLLDIYFQLNKLEKKTTKKVGENKLVVGDMINNVFVSVFNVLPRCDIDGYYNGKNFYQLFLMREKGLFVDLFAGKYIPEVAQGYCDMECSSISISGLSKIPCRFFTTEEIEDGHITEDRLLEIYFKVNNLENKVDDNRSFKGYIRQRRIDTKESGKNEFNSGNSRSS